MTVRERWKHKLYLGDFFHDEEKTFEQIRDEVARRIRRASWFEPFDTDDYSVTLENLVEEIEGCTNADDFDEVWTEFYDWADENRIWVDTWKRTT